jgi:tetratricopeptide (TPR) repeat protein
MVTFKVCTQLFLIAAFCQVVQAAELSEEVIEKSYYDSYASEKAQDYAGAMKALHPVFSVYPSGYTVNFRMGWLSYLNGNYADALRYYKTSLAIYPASLEVMNCISLVHKIREEWPKVEIENYAILKIDYFNQTGNYWYAFSLKKQGKYDPAEKVMRKMLTVFPTSVSYLSELGEILYLKKDYKQALSLFLSVKVLDPLNENAKKYIELISTVK